MVCSKGYKQGNGHFKTTVFVESSFVFFPVQQTQAHHAFLFHLAISKHSLDAVAISRHSFVAKTTWHLVGVHVADSFVKAQTTVSSRFFSLHLWLVPPNSEATVLHLNEALCSTKGLHRQTLQHRRPQKPKPSLTNEIMSALLRGNERELNPGNYID